MLFRSTNLSGGLTIRNAGGLVTFGTMGWSGTPGNITITQAEAGVLFAGDVFASTLTITDTADNRNVLFADGRNVRLSGFAAAAQGYNIDIRSSLFTVTNDVNLLNTGSLALGNAATDALSFAGGFGAVSQNAITLAGLLTTTNTQIDIKAFTLTANSTIDSGNAAASVINLGAINAAAFDLILDSGTNAAAALTEIGRAHV